MQLKILFLSFFPTNAVYFSLGLHKRRPSYRRSLQQLKNLNFITFSIFVRHFWVFALLDLDPDPDSQSGYGSRDPMVSGSNLDTGTL
jgi:hypothetical protein